MLFDSFKKGPILSSYCFNTGADVVVGHTSIDADVKELEQLDEKSEEETEEVHPPEEEEKPEETEEQEEEKTEEEQEEEETQEEKEEKPVGSRPSLFKGLKEAYPDIFKKFPELREVYFREGKYSEIFPTVEDAQSALEQSESFQEISNAVLSGNVEHFLEAVKEADENGVQKVAENFLPSLRKHNQDLYFNVVTPLYESLVQYIYKEGKASGNEDLVNSALQFSKHIFGDLAIAKGEKTTVRKSEVQSNEASKLDSERKEYEATKFNDASADVNDSIHHSLDRLIADGLDPDEVLSPYMKKVLVSDIKSEIFKQVKADRFHISKMNSFWQKAQRMGYSREAKSRIISAYLERVKPLVASVRNKAISEALGTKRRADRKLIKRGESNSTQKHVTGNEIRRKSGVVDSKNIDYSQTSDMDIIEGNVKTRR